MSIERGTYIIKNVVSGTVLDLAGYDDKSVIGESEHGRENQQWKIEYLGGGYSIRSVRSEGYISFESLSGNGVGIVAINYPTPWMISHEAGEGKNVVTIAWPNSTDVIDLDGGSSAARTKVQVWERIKGNRNQLWNLEKVG